MFLPTPMTDHGTPSLHIDGPVATVRLNRPEHRNRLHAADLVALKQHFQTIDNTPQVRVAVLTAQVAEPRPVFCAGYHIGEHGQEQPGAGFEDVADALEALRPITLCALNGSIYGGATDFALACDFAIGVTGMNMRMPAAALGLHYYPGGLKRFVSRLGLVAAKQAFLGAETFDDQTLLRLGYVQRLVPAAQHTAAVAAQVQSLLALAPLAQRLLKTSLNELARGQAQTDVLRERMRLTQQSHDFAEAALAFAAKRPPQFTGQ